MRNVLKTLAVLAGVVALISHGALAAGATPQARYDKARAFLTRCQGCFEVGIKNTPEDVAALNEYWQAIQDWTVDDLNSHPTWTFDRLKSDLLNYSQAGTGLGELPVPAPSWVTSLGQDLYAFTAKYSQIGNLFLVGKRDGRFAVVWDIRNAATNRFPELAAWNGSLYAWTLAPLPADSNGRPRFFVMGAYGHGGGFTGLGQLSVWSWQTNRAIPLFVKEFYYWEELNPIKWDAGAASFRVTVKEDY